MGTRTLLKPAAMPRIADVLHTLFATNEPLDLVLSRFFAKDYRQRVNGRWLSRDEAVAHFEHLQKIVDTVQVRVLGELMQELKYADRHVVTVHKKDGSVTVQEVYLFAELDAQGRFRKVEEVTLMLEGTVPDQMIGYATS